MNPVTYRSRVDGWLVLVFLVVGIGVLTLIWHLISTGVAGRLAALLVLFLPVGLPLYTVRSTYYTLTDEALLVRSGFARWRIDLPEIVAITPTRDAHSGPALSLDRLRVEYGRGRQLLISPELKEQFLSDLARRHARRRGPR